MQKKSNINWWVVLAVIVVCVPVGYVGTGYYKKLANKEVSALADTTNVEQKDTAQYNNIQEKDSDSVDVPDEEQEEKKDADEATDRQEVKTSEKKVEKEVDEETLRLREERARLKREQDEIRRLEQERKNAEKAEKQRLEQERQERIKAEKAEKDRLKKEEEDRKNAEQAQKVSQLKSDAQDIVASGRTDSRFPDNCKVVGNGVNTTYKQFRTNVTNNSYESVKVVSVTPDKNGNASKINVSVVRPNPNEKEKLEKEEKKRKEKEELDRRNNELKNELKDIVAKGQRSSKVPDDCTILVNGRNKKDYQSFRMGVKLRAYSDVKVNSVSTDSKGNVTQINVSATESKDSD